MENDWERTEILSSDIGIPNPKNFLSTNEQILKEVKKVNPKNRGDQLDDLQIVDSALLGDDSSSNLVDKFEFENDDLNSNSNS